MTFDEIITPADRRQVARCMRGINVLGVICMAWSAKLSCTTDKNLWETVNFVSNYPLQIAERLELEV